MIIKIKGGLGNQLFQYAFGRALPTKDGNLVKFDISNYDNDPLRSYKLKYFNIEDHIASRIEIFFNKVFTKVGLSSSYLEGYWQSEKYFLDIKDIIKKEFTLKDPLGGTAKMFIDQITSSNAISLHVRRGDYVTNGKLKNILQPLPVSYYKQAIELISKQRSNPHFFVFSDDVDWVKENLDIKYPVTYVLGENLKDYEELVLMSVCKDNITANSSFSWWGAWLNNNPDKVVIAPKNWFSNEDTDSRDLIPESWIRL
jgi:hypothetical protein